MHAASPIYLCIFVILLASALFVLGYEGTQIREFLLGVAAIIVVAWRVIRPQSQKPMPKDALDQTEDQREQRLSLSDQDQRDQSDFNESSESDQQSG